MAFQLCSSLAIIDKAGAGASGAITSSYAIMKRFSEQAEGVINAVSRFNWTDAASRGIISDEVKGILADAASNIAAISVVTADMTGYNTRIEAEDIINVLRDAKLMNLGLLKDQKRVKFINGT